MMMMMMAMAIKAAVLMGMLTMMKMPLITNKITLII